MKHRSLSLSLCLYPSIAFALPVPLSFSINLPFSPPVPLSFSINIPFFSPCTSLFLYQYTFSLSLYPFISFSPSQTPSLFFLLKT